MIVDIVVDILGKLFQFLTLPYYGIRPYFGMTEAHIMITVQLYCPTVQIPEIFPGNVDKNSPESEIPFAEIFSGNRCV